MARMVNELLNIDNAPPPPSVILDAPSNVLMPQTQESSVLLWPSCAVPVAAPSMAPPQGFLRARLSSLYVFGPEDPAHMGGEDTQTAPPLKIRGASEFR